ncbi:MAG: cation:proton antiporter [Candidatus Hydrogenedentes bacterium]|nr:cation:proton antiporter [Candidatus Hydrogenedentota bacterium]
MPSLSHHDMITLLLALGLLIGTARLLGEFFVWLQLPSIIGELLAGVLLGPTVFGRIAPAMQTALFPTGGAFPVALDAFTGIAIVLFLLVAGMEVDLSTAWRQGKAGIYVAVLGMVFSFAIGFSVAWFTPVFHSATIERDPLVFSLFFAVALSISALPVVAKILLDLGLFRSDVGMTVIAAAILNDLVGWITFAFLSGLLATGRTPLPLGYTLILLAIFVVFMLSAGRKILDRALPWIQAHTSWPGGVLGFSLAIALFCAAYTEAIGTHGVLGAFIFGIALGDSRHLRGRTRRTFEQFISFIFAPLFFASIGLKVNFAANFELWRVLLVLVLATIGKVVGCGLGAYFSGMGKRESWAVGFAMNARGAMEIILGLLALEANFISERMFVALVVMALVTSMTAALMMKFILKLEKPRRFFEFIPTRGFVSELETHDHREAIYQLSRHLAGLIDRDPESVAEGVWRREQIMSTSLGGGVAVPHARLDGLKTPAIVLGISKTGIDFDAADGELVHVVCLILTPRDNPDQQIDVLADIARTFRRPGLLERVLDAGSNTEILSVFKTEDIRRA